jgi:hypothetical protein
MMVVAFVGFPSFSRKEDVPVGMNVVSADTWAEAKVRMMEKMEEKNPHRGMLEVWDEESI